MCKTLKITLYGASKLQKRDHGNSKLCFTIKDQFGRLSFELDTDMINYSSMIVSIRFSISVSYNETTLVGMHD